MSVRIDTARCTAICLLLVGTTASLAADPAANYPSRPVRVVVPFTPGGQPDIIARMIAPKLTEFLGQQVVVDNRPGAGGTIGSRIVASSNPDGYTLLSISAAHVVAPTVRANLGYDTMKDFAGVTMTGNAAYYLVVPPSLGVKTAKELFAPAKTPRAVINKLNREAGRALKLPDVDERLNAIGIEPAPSTPAQLETFVAGQLAAARQLALKAGIKPE